MKRLAWKRSISTDGGDVIVVQRDRGEVTLRDGSGGDCRMSPRQARRLGAALLLLADACQKVDR